ISRLEARFDQSARLAEDIAARDALVHEMRNKLETLETTALREQKRLAQKNDDLTTENGRLRADLKTNKEELTGLQTKLTSKKKSEAITEADKSKSSVWWWVAGGSLAAVALVAGVW